MLRALRAVPRASPLATLATTRSLSVTGSAACASFSSLRDTSSRARAASPTLRRGPLCAAHRPASSERSAAGIGDQQEGNTRGEQHHQQQQQQENRESQGGSFFENYRTFRQQRNESQSHRYQTLNMYLARLPPGLRELLLYSPLIALVYFKTRQARIYYLDDDERWFMIFVPARVRHAFATARSSDVTSSSDSSSSDSDSSSRPQLPPAHVSSLLRHAPPSDTPHITAMADKVSVELTALPKPATALTATVKASATEAAPEHISVSLSTEAASAVTTAAGDPRTTTADTIRQSVRMDATIGVATTCAYRAGHVRDAVDTAAAPTTSPALVAPFHAVTVRHNASAQLSGESQANAAAKARLEELKEELKKGGDVAAAQAAMTAYPHGVWSGPLEVLRDPATRRVVGYRTQTAA